MRSCYLTYTQKTETKCTHCFEAHKSDKSPSFYFCTPKYSNAPNKNQLQKIMYFFFNTMLLNLY